MPTIKHMTVLPLAPMLLESMTSLLGKELPEGGYSFKLKIIQQDDAGHEYTETIDILGMDVIVEWETGVVPKAGVGDGFYSTLG